MRSIAIFGMMLFKDSTLNLLSLNVAWFERRKEEKNSLVKKVECV